MPQYHVQINTRLSSFLFSSGQGESLGKRVLFSSYHNRLKIWHNHCAPPKKLLVLKAARLWAKGTTFYPHQQQIYVSSGTHSVSSEGTFVGSFATSLKCTVGISLLSGCLSKTKHIIKRYRNFPLLPPETNLDSPSEKTSRQGWWTWGWGERRVRRLGR